MRFDVRPEPGRAPGNLDQLGDVSANKVLIEDQPGAINSRGIGDGILGVHGVGSAKRHDGHDGCQYSQFGERALAANVTKDRLCGCYRRPGQGIDERALGVSGFVKIINLARPGSPLSDPARICPATRDGCFIACYPGVAAQSPSDFLAQQNFLPRWFLDRPCENTEEIGDCSTRNTVPAISAHKLLRGSPLLLKIIASSFSPG